MQHIKSLRIITICFAVLTTSVFPIFARADFFSSVINQYNQSDRFPDPALATLSGGAKAYAENLIAPDFSIQLLKIQNSNFREGSVPVALYKFGGSTTTSARLIVILAGLFNNANDPLALHVLRLARAMSAHVLVIPNSFSTSYMNQGPLFAIADFVTEANVILQVTAFAIQSQFGKNNVSSVELIGESYGGFMVPVVLAQDADHVFGDAAVSLSPPVNILMSMGRIDSLITSQISQRSPCLESELAILEASEFAVSFVQNEITNDVAQCGSAFLADEVFQQSLVQSAMRMNGNIFNQLSIDQKNALTFNSFFNLFEPGVIQSRSPESMNFEAWLLQAETTHPKLKLRIMTSEDDFLNSGDQWNRAAFADLAHVQLTRLRWGGHLGFLTDPWFETLFSSLL